MLNRFDVWRPAFVPKVFQMGQQLPEEVPPPEITEEDITRWRVHGTVGGLGRATLSGLGSWAGIYMGRKTSGLQSWVGWGIGIISGLSSAVGLADAVFSIAAPQDTAARWTRMAQAQGEAMARELLR